jgi:alkanesulfonate monooxygenase SsuD/methylene tetrahydromethanopterin reductase-like flavin-dependent oxidoreductase (luciferase family)
MSLDFGLLYDLVVPRPWGPTTELDRFQAAIDQMVAADQNNFTHVWMVEHHFLEEYAHSSAPDAVLGAVAALTENVRIGFGVKLMPFGYNHPLRNAEMTATMDLVSKGRVEVGTGRSFSRVELEGFNVDPKNTRAQWEEGTRIMVEAWTSERMSWDSPTFQVPERCVLPKPIQKPHPPLWMAATSSDSHEVAGRLGFGVLSFTVMVPLDEIKQRVAIYEKALESADPIGHFANHAVGTYTVIHCADDTETAKRQAAEGIKTFMRRSVEIAAKTAAWMEGKVPDMAYLNQVAKVDLDQLTFEFLDDNDMCIVGDPERCIEKVRKYEEVGVTQLIGSHDVWGMPEEQKRRSIELFGQHVIPKFR